MVCCSYTCVLVCIEVKVKMTRKLGCAFTLHRRCRCWSHGVRHSLLRGQRRFGALEVPDVQMLDRRRPNPHRCHPTGRTRCSPLAPPQLWASSSVLTQTTRGFYEHVESRQRDDQKALQLRLVLLPAIVPAIVVFSAILHAIVFIQLLQLLVIKPQLSGQLKEHGAEDEEDLY